MATLNDWGDDPQHLVDEGIGDVAYDKIEDKAEEFAKDKAKDAAKAGGKALDKLTDKINPVKQAKDFVKDKISAVKKLKEKAKKGIRDLAKRGIKAVGKAALHAAKALLSFLAANPLLAVILIIGIIIIMSFMKNVDLDSETSGQTDEVLLENPLYVDIDGMMDDDVVVVLMGDCVSAQYDPMSTALDAEKEEHAKQIFSVFHEEGFTNISIAGMLACLDKESGFDPSAIEGIFSEYGFLGSRKAEALLDLNNYTEHTLFPAYNRNGTSINKDGYKATTSEGHTVYYCGLGLPQFTGPAALDLIRAAKTLDRNWYDMDFQLAYIACDSMYRSGFFAGWVNSQIEPDYPEEPDEDATEAEWAAYEEAKEEAIKEAVKASAKKFALDYEGVPSSKTDMIEERENLAVEWFNTIREWGDGEVDSEFVGSITALASELGSVIRFLDIEKVNFNCMNSNPFDNSTLANAAISFAWPTRDQSIDNDGTNLYRVVHDGLWPGETRYKDCGMCVAAAVMWSGTDDNYPLGTSNQLSYLSGSAKWELVGAASDLSMDDLLPGDVFIVNGHTFVYVSSELIQAAYGGEALTTSESVSASLDERSPGCDASSTNIIVTNNGQDPPTSSRGSRGTYYVFRCSTPDQSDTYKHLGSGTTSD